MSENNAASFVPRTMKSGASVFVAAVKIEKVGLVVAFAFGLPLPFPLAFGVETVLGLVGSFFDTPDVDFLGGAFLVGAFLVCAIAKC